MGSKRTGVQLAYPVDERSLSKMPSRVFFQRKLNGERVRISAGRKLLTSCENEIPFLTHIQDELVKTGLIYYPLDGELYCHGMTREEIHSCVSRRKIKSSLEEKIEFHVFDLVDETMTQTERIVRLKHIIPPENSKIKFVETFFDWKDKLVEYTDTFIKEGYEGSIIRNPESFYKATKGNHMLKHKPTSSDTYKIVSYEEEISIHGEPKDTLGSIIVIDSDGKIFSVGTGPALTKDSRQYWWERRDKLKGLYAKVKHSDILTVNGLPTCTSLLSIEIGVDKNA